MKFYSELTKSLYDTADACAAAEAAHLKAEEEKKNGHKVAMAKIDELLTNFRECQKTAEEASKEVVKAARALRAEYDKYQHNYGSLPDKHYSTYILTRMI